jgi:hypothetical protein
MKSYVALVPAYDTPRARTAGAWPPPPDEVQDEQGRWQPPDADKTPQDGWRDESDATTCQAVQHSDMMYCQACGLQWDVNDSEPPNCNPGGVTWRKK